MMKRWLVRLAYGLLFSILFLLLSVPLVCAGASGQADDTSDSDCQSCHQAVHAVWLESAHGRSVADPAFRDAWQMQGEPRSCLSCHTTGYDPALDYSKGEGITCEACHAPFTARHPDAPMPADRSANLCGTCHTATLFEWQVSNHREANMTCVSCHGQHSTSLKAEDVSDLCATCHRDRVSDFTHSVHSQEGLICADCHLGSSDLAHNQEGLICTDCHEGSVNVVAAVGHAVRDHSFNVKLSTCIECHSDQMHNPVEIQTDRPGPATEADEAVDALVSYETLGVEVDPQPVSPLGFATLSGLIGLAVGMLVAPWLERGFRYLSHDEKRGK